MLEAVFAQLRFAASIMFTIQPPERTTQQYLRLEAIRR